MDKKIKLNSVGEEDQSFSEEECHGNEQESGEIFEVDRVIDIRWLDETKDKFEYRVRWKNYKPIDDTWEPPEHFEEESLVLLHDFNKKYKEMREEQSSYLHERGKAVAFESIRHVNILSNEIEQITERTTVKEGHLHVIAYHVKWLGYKKSDSTWESEKELLHAQDKIDLFLHKKRIRRGKRHGARGKDLHDFVIPDYVRKKIQKTGTGPRSSFGNTCGKFVESELRKNDMKEQFKGDGILAGLIPYNHEDAKKAMREQSKHTLILSKTEFCDASDQGDYDTIYSSINSEKIPDVDFTSLFLKASRRGQRDLALLLSTYVPNLSARDDWGDTAFTIAAKLGDVCFAHYLLVLDVPIGQRNSEGQTAKEIAIKLGQLHFVKFLQDYEKGNL